MKTFAASLALLAAAVIPQSQAASACDRSCLREIAIGVLDSMQAKDASRLPLARHYAMTENGAPVSPVMASLWRTVTGYRKPGDGQWVIDPASGQVFVVAHIEEGPSPAVFFGRFKVSDRRIDELELYVSRSKGESGQLFSPDALDRLPSAWGAAVSTAQLPSRADLTQVGRSVFDRSAGNPSGAHTCELVEMGGRVIEDPEALKVIMQQDAGDLSHRQSEGGVSVPCTASDRPEDSRARVIVDVEQGVTVSLGVVEGVVFPSFITQGLESTFVPKAMTAGWERLPKAVHDPNGAASEAKHARSGLAYVPMLRSMPASMAVAEMTRFYDGQIQGVQRYLHIQPVSGGSPWALAAK